MAWRHPVMAGRIASLEDSAFSLCASINKHLRTSGSEHKAALKVLVVELRRLGGSLHSLQTLIHELQDNDEESSRDQSPRRQKTEWPLVDGCELLIKVLETLFRYSSLEGLRQAKSALLGYRSKLGFVLGSSESLDDISLHFSVLGKEPLPQLNLADDKKAQKSRDTSHNATDVEEEEPTSEEVSSWLTILNSAEEDREPAEYCEEKTLLQTRRLTTPQYQIAAARWPRHAETYWTKLRPQVCSLFRIPKSHNFVQWVLEYARETYPRIFGSSALSPKVLLELTDALCDGSISSFHIAAALGLPSLCRDLLSMGADINQRSLLGSPLYCALVGPKVLATRVEPESWTFLLEKHHAVTNRAATILLLLENRADCKYQYRWKNADEASLAGLAFWTALVTKHEPVFRMVVQNGASLDNTFLSLLQRSTVAKQGLVSKTRFARLLTYVYDYTLSSNTKTDLELVEDDRDVNELLEKIRETTSGIMKTHNLDFLFFENSHQINIVEHDAFNDLVRNAILESDFFLLQRLSHDPRFNPNLTMGDPRDGFSLLHLASEGSQLDMIDILVKAGASLCRRDSHGRTPVMVVEGIAALAKLVLDHGAETTDQDIHGRTIWHFAAASNDDGLLKWLIDNDPSKEKCLAIVNRDDATPLGDALFYVNTLKLHSKVSRPSPPTAARLLLKEYREIPQRRLRHHFQAAIQWGDMELLDGLLKLEPNFWESDYDGRSMLHFLNLSASEDLTSRVMELCQGLPIHTQDGSTPAETILTNTPLSNVKRKGFPTASHHPACHHQLNRDAYNRLLTREVLEYRDPEGRGIWQRFCAKVVPMIQGPVNGIPEQLAFLIQSITVAASCLAQHGAIADYERETSKSAFLCLVDEGGERSQGYRWHQWKFTLFRTVLEISRSEATKAFLGSERAVYLLLQCVVAGDTGFVDMLIERGVPVHCPSESYTDIPQLEDMIFSPHLKMPMVEVILKHITMSVLQERQHVIFRHLHARDVDFKDAAFSILKFLIHQGFNLNQIPTQGTEHRSILADAIAHHDHELVNFLLDNGADPSFGPFGYGALMAVAETGCDKALPKIIEVLDQNDGYDWDNYYDPPDGQSTFNVLQMAASRGHNNTLAMLLDRTELALSVNETTPRNRSPPIHLAIKARALACIETLVEYDAEVESEDGDGWSPLRLASRIGYLPAVHYLLHEVGVDEDDDDIRSAMVIGRGAPEGRTPRRELVPALGIFRGTPSSFTPSVRRKLGQYIADGLDTPIPSGFVHDAIFGIDILLEEVPSENFGAAILPCEGCTPLSYAIHRGHPEGSLSLAINSRGGFITGCRAHWPSGFNALVSVFSKLDRLISDSPDGPQYFLEFLTTTLNAYLEEGLLWLNLPCTPIHAMCNRLNDCGENDMEYNSAALKLFLDHLEEHADEYWKAIEETGLASQLGLQSTGGDPDLAAKLLSLAVNSRARHGTSLGSWFGDNVTPLHLLVDYVSECLPDMDEMKHLMSMIKLLLSAGADVNAQDDTGSTPLHTAISHQSDDLVKVLLEAGADPNIRDDDGATALALAMTTRTVGSSSGDMWDLLKQHGADTWVLADMGSCNVVSTGKIETMPRLLEMGLDLYAENSGRTSVGGGLVVLNSPSRSWALNKGFDFYKLAKEWPPLLHRLVRVAVTSQQVKMVIKRFPQECHYQLINPDARPQFNPGCATILHREPEPLQVLIDFGLDLEKECSSVGSPLMFACNNGVLPAVKVLVRHGARLSYATTDDYGRAIVRSAVNVARKFPAIVQWLLIGRHQEAKLLEWADTASSNSTIKPWSGPRRAEYMLNGHEGEYGKLSVESMVEWLGRLAGIRSQLYGKIVPAKLVDDMPIEVSDGDIPMHTGP